MQLLESHTVLENEGLRLSDYAVGIFMHLSSRKAVKKAIKRGTVFVNGQAQQTAYRVQKGDVIELKESMVEKPVFPLKLEVLMEDDHLAVIFKPGGIVTSGNQFRTLENALPFALKQSIAPDAWQRPRPVHRLDGPTCGLLMVAKTARAGVALSEMFQNGLIKKEYHAVVVGQTPSSGQIDMPISGKRAITNFETVQIASNAKCGNLSLLRIKPETGRTHQIRIHLASQGFPVHGDKIYGLEGLIFKGKGLFLCASKLSLTHPITGETLVVKTKLPPKFYKAVGIISG